MKKLFIPVLILILIIVTFSWAMVGQEAMVVREIKIAGNHGISTKKILEAIDLTAGDEVTEEDLKQVAQKIYDMGYFKEVVPNYRKENGKAVVTFKVTENPVLKHIEITGNQDYGSGFEILGIKIPKLGVKRLVSDSKIKEILEDAGVAKGEVLNNKALESGLENIIEKYEEKGYALIDIGQVNTGSTLSIQIIERKIEEIKLIGLATVPEEVARQYIHIPLDKPVKLAKLQEIFTDLSNSIFFKQMNQQDIELSAGSKIDKVKLTIHLRENKIIEEPTEINKIQVVGTTVYPGKKIKPKVEELSEGPITNYQVLKALQPIYNIYWEDGYRLMELEKEKLDRGVLTVRVYEGIIADVKIEGNKRTKSFVIEKELTLKPGQVFNQQALVESYQNLQKLGYFKNVSVNFESTGQKGRAIILITITEKKELGSFNGALSYSQGAIVGKLSLSWKNLYGTGQDISLEYDRGLIGQTMTNWSLNYETHAFFPELKSLNLSLYRETSQEEDLTLRTLGGQASLGYPIADFTVLDLSTRYEHYYKEFEQTGKKDESGITGSVSVGVTYDNRDDPTFPTQGGVKSINLEQAGGFVVGPEFTKLNLTLTHHFSTWENQNIAVRGMGQVGFDLPSQERFTLGGVNTLRGINPAYSDRIYLLNTEYRIKLIEAASLAFFVDTGFGVGIELESSFGAELRANIPMGLVRIALAWPVEEGKIKAVKVEFGMGPMF